MKLNTTVQQKKNDFVVSMLDEDRTIGEDPEKKPDLEFFKSFKFGLQPQGEEESNEEFEERARGLIEMAVTEATRLYMAEFAPRAVVKVLPHGDPV